MSNLIKHIAFTCYPVTDMARARDFYENVLGLKPGQSFGENFQEYELGEGVFCLGYVGTETEMPDFFKSRAASLSFEVEDFDAALSKMKEHNVPLTMEPYETPVCRMCFITDPDNNVVGLHQLK